jgi:hypothetical protein
MATVMNVKKNDDAHLRIPGGVRAMEDGTGKLVVFDQHGNVPAKLDLSMVEEYRASEEAGERPEQN